MPDHPKYRVTDKIDAGGMAEVYRGTAETAVGGLKKAVAIKKILPSLTKNKKFVAMFLDEARVSMHLQHANVVGVFDIGIADTAYFIVMEYVDGANLKTILESMRRQGKRLPIAVTVYLMMEVCKGLHYAHEATDPENGRQLGIVHRDISPPNILISKRGEVKLVDFGLAKATSQLESTDPGVVKGKFSYLAPEAASGKDVDRRADIFAVGILLYELLTGKRLFYGETDYQTVELVRQAKVPAIAQQNPEVTGELEQIVRMALARDLSARYQTAGDLQESLAQFLFSQRLKVTSRDIEQLVAMCLQEKQRSQPKQQKPIGNIIDELINEEIVRFTSLDVNDPLLQNAGGQSPVDSGGAPLDPGSFVDARGWVEDLSESKSQRNGTAPRQRTQTNPGAEVGGLEDLLEGEGAARLGQSVQPTPSSSSMRTGALVAGGASSRAPAATSQPIRHAQPRAAKQGSGKLLALVAVTLVILAGGAAAAYFFLLKN